jgi:hypothetical protein
MRQVTLVNPEDGKGNGSMFDALLAFSRGKKSYREVEVEEDMDSKGYLAATQAQFEAQERLIEEARMRMEKWMMRRLGGLLLLDFFVRFWCLYAAIRFLLESIRDVTKRRIMSSNSSR